MSAGVTEGHDVRLECIRKVLSKLPIGNRAVVQKLMEFLTEVAAHSDVNMMTPSNLAVVW